MTTHVSGFLTSVICDTDFSVCSDIILHTVSIPDCISVSACVFCSVTVDNMEPVSSAIFVVSDTV